MLLRSAAVLQQAAWMTALVSHTAFDCHNAYELSEWWKQVLGYVDVEGDPNPPGTGWVVLADPEGNEFCIVRSQAEREEG